MQRSEFRWFLVAVLVVGGAAVAESYWWNSTPVSHYGTAYFAAATATQIPSIPTQGRSALSLQNQDVATVFCGDDANVTASSYGIAIASGQQATIRLSYNSAPPVGNDAGTVYCYSTLGVVNDAGVSGLHYWELQ